MLAMAQKQRRPKWVTRKLTPIWQKRVIDELRDRGWQRQELARRLGCTPGGVTGLLKPGALSSRLVEPTCELLEIPGPEFDDDIDYLTSKALLRLKKHARRDFDDIVARAMRAAAKLSPENS